MVTVPEEVHPLKQTRTWPVRLLPWVMLFALLAAGFGVRMVNLKDPPLDFHPVRQLRSALIARGLYYQANLSADPAKAPGRDQPHPG